MPRRHMGEHSFTALALDGTEWSLVHPGGFNAMKMSPAPTVTIKKSKVMFMFLRISPLDLLKGLNDQMHATHSP